MIAWDCYELGQVQRASGRLDAAVRTHPEPDDAFWVPRRASVAAGTVPPAHLMTGWADGCLDPTLSMYRRLRPAGRRVRLVVGPWNHTSGFRDDMPTVFSETLGWLRAYLRGDDSGLPAQPVRVWVGAIGSPGQWRDLPGWPPPDVRAKQRHLDGDGTLTISPAAGEAVSSFRYDPARPVTGLLRGTRSGGRSTSPSPQARSFTSAAATSRAGASPRPRNPLGVAALAGCCARCRPQGQAGTLPIAAGVDGQPAHLRGLAD